MPAAGCPSREYLSHDVKQQRKVAPPGQNCKTRELIAMIGVAGENRHRPVNLFGGHDSHQVMRPSHRPQGERERSGCQKRGFQTSGPPPTNAAPATPWSRARPSSVARLRLVTCVPFSSRAITFAGVQASPEWLLPLPCCVIGTGGAALPGLTHFDAGKADRAAGADPLGIARANSRSGPAFGRPTQIGRRRIVFVMGCLSLSGARPAGRCSTFFRDCRTASPRAGRCG